MKSLQTLIGCATLALLASLPGIEACKPDPYKITEDGSLVDQLASVNKELKLSKVAQHVAVALSHSESTETLDKLFSSAVTSGYSPCNRESEKEFPLEEGGKHISIAGSKYSQMDTFSGPIWPFLLEAFKDSEVYEKKVDGIDCGDQQLSELCTLGGLLAAVTGESYKAFNAYLDNGKEVNVEEMRAVLGKLASEKGTVSLWESTSGFQKIVVDYKEPDVAYFTTDPSKQGQADKKTDLVRNLVTERAYRAGSIAKSTFVLFPTKWLP